MTEFIITNPLFWKFTWFYLSIYLIVLIISATYQAISDWSWYGIRQETLIGAILHLMEICWLFFPIAFLIDLIHLLYKSIF